MFCALTVLLLTDVADPPFDGLDEAADAAGGEGRSFPLAVLATGLHYGGKFPWNIPLMLLVAAGALYARRHWTGVALVLASWALTSAVTVPLVKVVLDRERPLDQLVQEASASYPSGHTAFAAMMGVTVVAIVTRYRGWAVAAAVAFTAAMAWSRVYLGVHWLSDTVAGAAIGAGVPLVAWWLWLVIEERRGAMTRADR
ncbi:undecaprenyl-diphosphatase [Murinocardiopsis flavida]|uniref:Undecaprenyl-diphosphatase n=1 Tax=Murinocardiopsis flavida TaxID=645275 RepID=A0A2P8DKB8_9ACTN|nr:undecaprenyl-diphosphatase [Murinocardiopsis flavida]